MRVWIVSKKGALDWDDIEGVFLQMTDAKDHLRSLEKDFPEDEYAMESLRVIE